MAQPKPDKKLIKQLRGLVKSTQKELTDQQKHLANTQAEFDKIC